MIEFLENKARAHRRRSGRRDSVPAGTQRARVQGMTKQTLTVTLPDGITAKRATHRTYRFVLACESSAAGAWRVVSWHITEEAALKARTTWQRRLACGSYFGPASCPNMNQGDALTICRVN
jgi:hypothetical protein